MRPARPDDVPALCRFGARVVPAHYAPLIGQQAADAQVDAWWTPAALAPAVADGLVVVAELSDGPAGGIVGVGQRGRMGADHVIWKLYVDPAHRGSGLGPRLLRALTDQLPPEATRVVIEHFAGNVRAGAFYEREGFAVERITPHPSGEPARATVWRAGPRPGGDR